MTEGVRWWVHPETCFMGWKAVVTVRMYKTSATGRAASQWDMYTTGKNIPRRMEWEQHIGERLLSISINKGTALVLEAVTKAKTITVTWIISKRPQERLGGIRAQWKQSQEWSSAQFLLHLGSFPTSTVALRPLLFYSNHPVLGKHLESCFWILLQKHNQ